MSVRLSVCVSFWAYTRRRLWSDRDQIRHTHADSSRNGNGLNKKNCPSDLGGMRGVLGGHNS